MKTPDLPFLNGKSPPINLGKLIDVHMRKSFSKTKKLLKFGRIIIFLVPSMILAGIALLILGQAFSLGMFLLFTGALLLIPTLLFTFVFTLSEDLASLAIYEQGFVHQNEKKRHEVRWDEISGIAISAVRYGESKHGVYNYFISDQNGNRHMVTESMERYQEAIQRIEEYFHPILKNRIVNARKNLQNFGFGFVSLGEDGIQYGTFMCPWSAVVSQNLKQGFWIMTYKTTSGQNALLSIRVNQIENYNYFEAEVANRAQLTNGTSQLPAGV
jgi:hypothetical protein